MSAKAHVIVYSKPGCHLCEEAKAVINGSGCKDKFELTEINIETDPSLLERYRYDIPVISINGVDTFKHRLDSQRFREVIESLCSGN